MEAISTSFIWIIRASGNAPPPIRLPSGEYAHAFTFVRAPLSFDFTTITVFCFRLFSTSQMLKLRKDFDASRERKAENIPYRGINGASDERLGILRMPRTGRQFCDVSAKRGSTC